MKNKAAIVNLPELPKGGDGIDMAQMMELFASKSPPDNTINRIEALEKQIAKIGTGGDTKGPGLDADAMDKLNDMLRRVQALETRADKTDRNQLSNEEMFADHERRLKLLESKEMPMPEITSSTGEVDMSALKQFIALEVSKVRLEVNNLDSKIKTDLD